MSGDPPEYDLVMPFVVVWSKGGLYADDAYCAGWEMGRLDSTLDGEYTALPDVWETTIHTGNRLQADLIAMRHGFTAEWTDCPEAPEWTHATFTRRSR